MEQKPVRQYAQFQCLIEDLFYDFERFELHRHQQSDIPYFPDARMTKVFFKQFGLAFNRFDKATPRQHFQVCQCRRRTYGVAAKGRDMPEDRFFFKTSMICRGAIKPPMGIPPPIAFAHTMMSGTMS